MLTKMVNMNNNQQQRENNAVVYQAPPLPLKLTAQQQRSNDYHRQRAPLSNIPEADSHSGPYKSVPAPKPLQLGNGPPPPPYRQPPPPANSSSSPVLAPVRPHLHHQPGNSSDPSAANSESSSNHPGRNKNNSSINTGGHALLAYSSKFPIEREVVVTTNDKVAEVSRIQQESTTESRNNPSAETGGGSENMQGMMVTQSAWMNEERRSTVTHQHHQQGRQQQQQQQHGVGAEVIAGAPHHAGHHYPDVFDHATSSEEMHRPASYMPMHIHYTGWRQESNYVPMNFDGRIHSSTSGGDPSISFDSALLHSSGPPSLQLVTRDPFAPSNNPASAGNNMMTHYEIHVDNSAERPSTVTVAPWGQQQHQGGGSSLGDTSTFDRLRDTCNKMFLRDGNLRGSSQFAAALSPTLPRAMERLTVADQRINDPPTGTNEATEIQQEERQEAEKSPEEKVAEALLLASNNKSGSMRKKLTGKTYHHIKDMFTTKFSSNKISKSKIAGPKAENGIDTSATTGINNSTETNIIPNGQSGNLVGQQTPVLGRQPDPVHSINQRIHSQITSGGLQQPQQQPQQQQVWGSYGRQSASNKLAESSIDSSVDATTLAKLTLGPSTAHPHSPYNLRHNNKPSVTFRMDLNNECQYSGGDNSSSTTEAAVRYVTGRATQGGQVVLYDDTMHFPQHQHQQSGIPGNKDKIPYQHEHDSSLSSIASAGHIHTGGTKGSAGRPPVYSSYADYDVPPNKSGTSLMMNGNEGGSSSGHQSAGSSSDLDKRSGQSISTNDSGVGVITEPISSTQQQRNRPLSQYQSQRPNSEQNSYHLDTSTETEMFVGRSGHQTSSDWADAADREVNNVMELRSYSQQHQQPWLSGENTSNQQAGPQSSTPPLPPLSPDVSPKPTPKMQQKKFSNVNSSKPDLLEPAKSSNSPMIQRVKPTAPAKPITTGVNSTNNGAGHNQRSSENSRSKHSKRRGEEKGNATKNLSNSKLRGASKSTGALHPLTALQEALDLGEITSTTTGLDLDNDSDSNSSHSDDDLSTTMDMNESRTIRRQLEGLESMYSEVLKALHKKSATGRNGPGVDHKLSKRRMYGSVSSLPSSVCSRPIYRDRRRHDDRRRPKDNSGKAANKRFQRLESHVVTLARSVAHLSSEMRTQHIMIQEMETIRSEIAQLRASPLRLGTPYGAKLPRGYRVDRDTCWQGAVTALTDPSRVKKLTSFFGDEPPLLRIFLKKLGYEKYSPLFDQEKIGMIELPYLTEERLHKMGIPMGPRIRILQEAQLSLRTDNISDYGMV